jgi:hypothetical protein
MNNTYISKPLSQGVAISKPTISQRILTMFVPLVIFMVALLPRVANLDVFLTADEDDQIMFASLFLEATLKGDPANALVLGYPGVPTLILGAVGVGLRYLFHFSGILPLHWVDTDLMTTLQQTTSQFGVFDHPLDFILWVRVPMAIAAALCVMGIYLLSRRLLGEPLALLSTLIIAFDPFILAHTRVIHVDAPLAYFMFLSFLAFMLYIVDGKWRYLIIAGLFAGLAALSKTGPAAFLGPILVASGFFYAAFYPCPPEQSRKIYWKRFAFALVGCGLIGAISFFALWPTMWSQPTKALSWILANLKSVNRIYHPTSGIFWGGRVTDQSPYYYLFVLPYHLTPLTSIGILAGLLMVIIGSVRRQYRLESWLADKYPLALSLISYVILFVLPVSMVSRRGDRYILPVYFATSMLAALGLWWLAIWLAEKTDFMSKIRGIGLIWRTVAGTPGQLLGGTVLLQIFSVLLYHPYYLAYYNPLMGGGETAPYILNIGWGEGLDQAARYLNEVTEGKPPQVAAWYSNQFAPFYKGRTVDLSDQGATLYSDYTVFYLNQVQRGFPSGEVLEYFRQREPLHVVNLGGVEYAWIYEGPVISKQPPDNYTFAVGKLLGGANLLGVDVPVTTMPADQFAVISQEYPEQHPIFSKRVPGLPVTLHWETINRMHGEHNVYIRLVDAEGNNWGQIDRLILAGLWRPDRWQPGFIIRDEYRLPIDPATPPGTYHLEVGLYDFATGQTYGLARNIGEITLTAPKKLPTLSDINMVEHELTTINNSLRLVGHTYQDIEVAPGEEITGKVFWQMLQTVKQNYTVQFWLRSPGSEHKYIVHESAMSPSYPTSEWQQSEIVVAAYRLRASAYAPAGDYPLMVSVIDPATGESIGENVTLAKVTVKQVKRNFELPQDVTQVSALLNEEIELVGFRLDDETVKPNDSFGLTLYWRSLRPAQANYTVFIHAVGPDKSMRGQWDSMPVQGTVPTSGWLPGEIIEDHHEVLMDKDAPPWKYDVLIGMYDATTGQRLPIHSVKSPVLDDRVWLTQVLATNSEQ